jgi:hypothetical protein
MPLESAKRAFASLALILSAGGSWAADCDRTRPCEADDESDDLDYSSLPAHLRDRGPGLPISERGNYIRAGEWLVLPMFGYSSDEDFQYDPAEFGFPRPPDLDEFLGRYRADEGGLLVAYAFSDRLALELNAATVRATLDRASDDASGFPARVRESGLGNVSLRADWRWLSESGRRPEIDTYVQARTPHDSDKVLIGTPDWVFNVGIGATRGFDWGTLTFRVSAEYDLASASTTDWGEATLEYLKRISPRFRALAALTVLQGDEASFIGQLQWQVSEDTALELGSGVALTPEALDWTPRLGFVISLD